NGRDRLWPGSSLLVLPGSCLLRRVVRTSEASFREVRFSERRKVHEDRPLGFGFSSTRAWPGATVTLVLAKSFHGERTRGPVTPSIPATTRRAHCPSRERRSSGCSRSRL